jgi:hypothetical protein
MFRQELIFSTGITLPGTCGTATENMNIELTISLFMTTKLINQMNVIQMIINKISSYDKSFT